MDTALIVDEEIYEYELIDHIKTRWFLDEDWNLYIITPATSDLENYGPDNEIMDKMNDYVRMWGDTPSEEWGEALGLLYVPFPNRRYNTIDGYYFA